MKTIDQIPTAIGLFLSALMVLGGLLLGWQYLPEFFANTPADSIMLSAGPSSASGQLQTDQLQTDATQTDQIQKAPQNIVFAQATAEVDQAQQNSNIDVEDSGASDSPSVQQEASEAAETDPTKTEEISEEANQERQTEESSASSDQTASISDSLTETTPVEIAPIFRPIQLQYGTTPPPTLHEWLSSQSYIVVAGGISTSEPQPTIHIGVERQNGIPVFKQTYVAATRFNTLETDLSLTQIRAIWQGTVESLSADRQPAFGKIFVLQEDVPGLTALLGTPSAAVEFATSIDLLEEGAKSDNPTLVLVPFEKLIPSWTALAINGENPVENTNNFTDGAYPLKVPFYLRWENFTNEDQPQLDNLLSNLPNSNRDPNKLTVIAMTGVTAMVRGTAAQMDRFGSSWPAEIVGPELASADITHISNEVPFVENCETENSSETLIFCSKLSYMDALLATGVDIIGLTGNHQNDYGRDDALASLEFYAEHNLPVYGGGINQEEANAPLYLTHNGNRLAFLGANSYGPNFAWATPDRPGSARFDLNIMSANIRAVKERDLADVVFAELQYQETYEVTPLIDQRLDFNALLRAGADVVTGVQSHVPQAIEFTDGKLVLFGLGNLFFDQMWSQPVREGLIVKHTVYNGRHISTQLLTTMLHDFGQPHWTTPQERELLLNRIFQASYWE